MSGIEANTRLSFVNNSTGSAAARDTQNLKLYGCHILGMEVVPATNPVMDHAAVSIVGKAKPPLSALDCVLQRHLKPVSLRALSFHVRPTRPVSNTRAVRSLAAAGPSAVEPGITSMTVADSGGRERTI